MWIFWLIGISGFLVLIWLCLISTNSTRGREGIKEYTAYRYAHRGLHDNKVRAENTLSAFDAAIKAGYAIELDVRLCRDGELVVCHDPTLLRVADDTRRVSDLTVNELKKVDLFHTGEGVPTFREVLDLVGGRVPLLVEIKEEAGEKGVAEATCKMLVDYNGPFLIESFNPFSLAVVKRLLPRVYRGFLCEHLSKSKKYRGLLYRVLELFLLNFLCLPDFIAYNFTDRDYLPYRVLTTLYRPVTFAWTVRSEEEEKTCHAYDFNAVIFENYTPTEN